MPKPLLGKAFSGWNYFHKIFPIFIISKNINTLYRNMIHSIEVSYVLSIDSFLSLVADIYNIPNISHKAMDLFLRDPDKTKPLNISSLPKGLTRMVFYYNKENKSTIYLKITLDLQALIYGEYTIDLFTPSYGTTLRLCYAYAEAILKVFPSLSGLTLNPEKYIKHNIGATNVSSEALPYLILATTTDIEYTLNFLVPEEEKEATLKCVKASYYNGTKTVKDFNKHVDGTKNYNLYAENTLSSTKLYDKGRYYEDKNLQISDQLRESAKNVLRYEYSVRRNLRDFITKNYNIPYKLISSPFFKSPVTLFDYNACHKILQTIYDKEVGLEDWYADYQYKNIINASALSKHKKSVILKDIAPTLSLARSIIPAIEKYVNGYVHPKSKKKIKGSAATFKGYLNDIRSLNLQPYKVPDRDKRTHIINPMKSIIQNDVKIKREYDIPPHIKRNIDCLLQHVWLKELNRPVLQKCELTKNAS